MLRKSKVSLFLGRILLIKTRMLYDFHQKQNAKKPGMIHATYLLSGTKKMEDPISLNGETKKDGEDDYMLSSPFMSSSMPQPEEGTGESSVLSITLVREEDLEGGDISQYPKLCLFSCRSTFSIRGYFFDTHLQSRAPSTKGSNPVLFCVPN